VERRLLVDDLVFAEAPRWRDGRLWFSDIFAQQVKTVDESGNCATVVTLDGSALPVGLGFLPDGRLLMTNLDRPQVLRLDAPGVVAVHADLQDLAVGIVNDMASDSTGRVYVGSSGRRDSTGSLEPRTGNVIAVEADGTARVVAEGVWGPNGPAITRDDSLYLVSELPAQRILAFDRASDGTLSNRRTWAELAPCRADGIAVDVENAVWTSSPAEGIFRRVTEGGTVTDTLDVGARRAVACALGGSDGRTLFLLTNRSSKIADEWLHRKYASPGAEPRATESGLDGWIGNSRIEAVRVSVPAW
jgi:sugar lactone lactonase YvrE